MPSCCDRAITLVLQNVLNSGPQEDAHFTQTVTLSLSAAKCFCAHPPSYFVHQERITQNDGLYIHPFDYIVNIIVQHHVDFVDVHMLVAPFGVSAISFRRACCTISRLSTKVFFHPTRSNLVRARTTLNIYDKISMLAAIGSSHIQGVSERDLGESYTLAGHDLLEMLHTGRVVSIHRRIYSASIARTKVCGALEAWQT